MPPSQFGGVLLSPILRVGMGCSCSNSDPWGGCQLPHTLTSTRTPCPAGTASIIIPILLLLILLTVVAFVWYKWRIKG